MSKPKGYWTKERVFEEARKYQTRWEFQKGCVSAYNVALKNSWLSEITHFIQIRKTKDYWTKERVFEEARNYNTKIEFRKGCQRAYEVARKNGWLKEMTWLVDKRKQKSVKKWNRISVFKEARKYKTRNDFRLGCIGAYMSAHNNNWINEMDWLVDGRVKLFTDKIDCVYKYYWEETNSIYIGRTLMRRQKIRDKAHIFDYRDTVHKYAKENGLAIPPMEIIEDNLTLEEGLDREDYWVNYYKEKGYNVLNTAKTGIGSGSLGAISWYKRTKEEVFKEARKYTTKSEFSQENRKLYEYSRRNGWLPEMDWFEDKRKPNGFWNIKENVFKEARKYNTRNEFQKGCRRGYTVARENGWLDELFPKYKSVA